MFISLPLEGGLTRDIHKGFESLDLPWEKLKVVEPDNMHLTLKFLGPTPIDKIPDIISTLDKIKLSEDSIELVTDKAQIFNEKQPRVLSIALQANKTLQELFDKIEKSASKLLQGDFYNKSQGRALLAQSLRLMLEEIHENPEEDILRRSVDFGHTFSPLVEMESVSNASYRRLPHGYAVAYDCLLSSVISNIRGKLSDSDLSRIFNLYLIFDFDLLPSTSCSKVGPFPPI